MALVWWGCICSTPARGCPEPSGKYFGNNRTNGRHASTNDARVEFDRRPIRRSDIVMRSVGGIADNLDCM